MVMMSGIQPRNRNCATSVAIKNTVMKNLKNKNKISPKRIEINPRVQLSKFCQQVLKTDECDDRISLTEKKKIDMSKSKKFGLGFFDDTKLHYADNSKVTRSCKRGPPGDLASQKLKRRKMNWSVTEQCYAIFKELLNQHNEWVFNPPVDHDKSKIPGYFPIISKPMDLQTIKSKLEKNLYLSVDEFVADVRLNFSNAMLKLCALDDDTLCELKRVMTSCLDAKAMKENSAKMNKIGDQQSLPKIVHKGMVGNTSGSCATLKSSLSFADSKCGLCGRVMCQCRLKNDTPPQLQSLNTSSSRISKSDHVSDGAASALNEGNIYSSSQLPTLGTSTIDSKKDVQLSPKAAIRATQLKTRFAGIIMKAQDTLRDIAGKDGRVKMKQERERLERLKHEAASRMKAEREREREAARLSLQEMEKNVVFEDNLQIIKDFYILSGDCDFCLEHIGLSLKDDYEDEENGSPEEGDIS